ncbi:hypothetical protein [Amycolatopsis kentuckyensis]|uniref:hypothetical protein n=1 Tax=Amycolatopsis kentuckyensis TaxID=218823 RepID=UPI000A36AC39|nr:hypothetical protein [Amycolatopsis kentuckyensis]
MRRRLIPEKLRWRLARALNLLPGQCWADLVCWVIGDDRRSPWSPIGAVCRSDRAATGCCWCGKLGDRGEAGRG